MQRRTLIIGMAAAGALGAGVANGSWRGGDVEFTRPPVAAPARIDLRGEPSSVYVGVPVDLDGVLRAAEAALPATPVAVVDWAANGACARRTQWVECTSAKLEGIVSRNGDLGIQLDHAGIKLRIPVRYDLAATGIGWTRHLTDHKSGDAVISVPFDVALATNGALEVAPRSEARTGETDVALLKATVRLDRVLEARLRPALKAAEEALRAAFARLPVRAAVNNAWTSLVRPMELAPGSGLWLYGMPESYGFGGLASVDGRTMLRVAITARLAVSDGEQASAAVSRRSQPVLSQAPAAPGPTRLRMAAAVDLESMRQAADAALVTGEAFETRVDRFTEPVKVKVRSTRVYAANRQIGLELDLDATTAKGASHSGKAHLVGRPVLDAVAGTVGVADVSFPPVSGKEQHGTRAAGLPRLGTEPFASRFAGAARLDIAQPLKDALPRATHLLNQKLERDMVLTAKLAEAVPVSLELARDGAYLVVDLMGELTFVYNGPQQQMAASSPASEAPATDSPIAASPVATVSAVAASAAAGTMAARKATKARQLPGTVAQASPGSTGLHKPAKAKPGSQRPFRTSTVFPADPI